MSSFFLFLLDRCSSFCACSYKFFYYFCHIIDWCELIIPHKVWNSLTQFYTRKRKGTTWKIIRKKDVFGVYTSLNCSKPSNDKTISYPKNKFTHNLPLLKHPNKWNQQWYSITQQVYRRGTSQLSNTNFSLVYYSKVTCVNRSAKHVRRFSSASPRFLLVA